MPFVRADTSVNIINAALLASGLAKSAAPFSSTDGAVIQIVSLLTDCMRELGGAYAWPSLLRTKTFTTVNPGDTGVYPLPADFDYMCPQTGWVKTDSIPLGGPVDAQIWQQFVNSTFTSNFYLYFREESDQFWVWPQPPPNGKIVSYKYSSRNYVLNVGVNKDYSDDPADVIIFDPLLIQKLLKLRFLEARGFDTEKAQAQYDAIYSARTGRVGSAPVLNLVNRPRLKLISTNNIPESTFG